MRDIGSAHNLEHKATVRQIEYHSGMILTLGTEDYIKIWDFTTVKKLISNNFSANF